jgi:hypothetical protein
MVEYWLDVFDNKPLEAHRNKDGYIQYRSEDPVINKWEQQIADGREPDLWEAFTPDAKDQLSRLRARSAHMSSGLTMKNAMERAERDARLQGLDKPSSEPSLLGTQRDFSTFGDGSDF